MGHHSTCFYTSKIWSSHDRHAHTSAHEDNISSDGRSSDAQFMPHMFVDISVSSYSWLYNHFRNNLVLDMRSSADYDRSHIIYSKNLCSETLLSLIHKATLLSGDVVLEGEEEEVASSLQTLSKLFSQTARNLVLISEDGFGVISPEMLTRALLSGDMVQLDKKQQETVCFIRELNRLTKISSVPPHLHLISEGYDSFRVHYPFLTSSYTNPCHQTSPPTHKLPTFHGTIMNSHRPIDSCNEIIPQVLYLGSISHVTSKHKLQSLNIKYLVNAAKEYVSMHYTTNDFAIVDHSCAILDLPTEDIMSKFDYVTQVIEQARREKYAVLVHCHAGVSRSATLVVAYLMKQYNMHLIDALEFVQLRRPCVNPNKGFINQLGKYELACFPHLKEPTMPLSEENPSKKTGGFGSEFNMDNFASCFSMESFRKKFP